MAEIIIRIKDAERTQTQRFMADLGFRVAPDDPLLKSYIEEAIKNFNGKPEDVIVKIICDW